MVTEFEKGYERGYKDGTAGAALPNVNDNGDKIDGYGYAYKTDSRGEPYIHIDSVRSMLKKAADVQTVRRGHWIWKERHRNSLRVVKGIDRYGKEGDLQIHEEYKEKVNYCSECGKQGHEVSLNFCPNCGTRMDGDTNGEMVTNG